MINIYSVVYVKFWRACEMKVLRLDGGEITQQLICDLYSVNVWGAVN